MSTHKGKYPIGNYIFAVITSLIEGVTFFMAGFNLVRMTDWIALICGIGLLILSAATIYGLTTILTNAKLFDSYADGIGENLPISEIFDDDDEEEGDERA